MSICHTTYKTNKYCLLILEIVGFTSINMNFIVSFAYLSSKRTNNFEWALNKVKGLFVKDYVLSQVIVNDRDLAFMNALETVFSSSINLLCVFHIIKNVKAKCKILVDKAEEWQNIMDVWELLL